MYFVEAAMRRDCLAGAEGAFMLLDLLEVLL